MIIANLGPFNMFIYVVPDQLLCEDLYPRTLLGSGFSDPASVCWLLLKFVSDMAIKVLV